MRLEQLRYFCAVAEENFSVSLAAKAARTSQPNVSKQIRLLEEELRVELLRRHKGRVVGLTVAGNAVLALAQGVLRDSAHIAAVPNEIMNSGEIRLSTTHLHARYVLPAVIRGFRTLYPRMQVTFEQADTGRTIELVSSGRADIGIASRTLDGVGPLARLPCFEIRRSVIAPLGHPLLKRKVLQLQDIASWPLVAYGSSFSGGLVVQRAFQRAGLRPTIAVAASDSEIVKTYVRLGFGIAVLPGIAYNPRLDRDLRVRDVSDMFERTMVDVLVRPDSTTRRHVRDFIDVLTDAMRTVVGGREAAALHLGHGPTGG